MNNLIGGWPVGWGKSNLWMRVEASFYMPYYRVPVWPIKTIESWGYLTGNWRGATPYHLVILINMKMK